MKKVLKILKYEFTCMFEEKSWWGALAEVLSEDEYYNVGENCENQLRNSFTFLHWGILDFFNRKMNINWLCVCGFGRPAVFFLVH